MQRDNYANTLSKVALGAIALSSDTATATAGVIIDTTNGSVNFESGKIVLSTGVVTAGDIAITKIQESDDPAMAGATDIPSERLIGAVGTAITASATTAEVGFVTDTKKRYIQATFTTGNSADLLACAICEFGDPSYTR